MSVTTLNPRSCAACPPLFDDLRAVILAQGGNPDAKLTTEGAHKYRRVTVADIVRASLKAHRMWGDAMYVPLDGAARRTARPVDLGRRRRSIPVGQVTVDTAVAA